MFRQRERGANLPREEGPERVLEERIRREAFSAARLFFEENRNNHWILIAGADIPYYFNQMSRDIPLSKELDFYAVAGFLDLFREQFNIELRRLIFSDHENEIAALLLQLAQYGGHQKEPVTMRKESPSHIAS